MNEKIAGADAIKLAITDIESSGLSGQEVLTDSITWLYGRYLITGDERYLRHALNHIRVYLQQGFPYKKCGQMFEHILDVLQMNPIQIMFIDEKYTKPVKLNKNQIRRMIRKWNPHVHSMPIHMVVEDIIKRVTDRQDGIYSYMSGKKKIDGKVVPKDEYRLLVYEGKAQFLDLTEKLYYTIQTSEKG